MAEGSWIRIGATKVHLDAKTVNSIVKEVLCKKAVSVSKMPSLRLDIGKEYLRAVTPFVPMKSGQLRASGRATDDGRVYWTAVAPAWNEDNGYAFNYAETVYDPNYVRWPRGETYKNPTTPNTVPRWTKQVVPGTQAYATFITNITPLIRRAFQDE
jgi:hypothetical protein